MPHNLTPREVEVVRLTTLGCNKVEIGKILGMSWTTVGTHQLNAMRKVGVRKSVLLTRWAIVNKVTSLKETLTPAEKRLRGKKDDGWS
jgi:DNA-binding CsgD family transcriptional regulator